MAPIFVLGPVGVIIGPLIFGLLTAAFRTAGHFGNNESPHSG